MKIFRNNRVIKWNSVITALAITEASVCEIMSLLLGIKSPFAILGITIIVLTSIVNKKIFLRPPALASYAVLIIVLLLSLIFNGKVVVNYLTTFAVFGLLSLIIVPLNFDFVELLKTSAVIYFLRSALYLFKQKDQLAALNIYQFDKVQMAIAFEFACAFIFQLTFLLCLKKYGMSYRWLLLIIPNLVVSFIVVFLDCHTRGAIVTIFFGIVVLILQKIQRGRTWILLLISIVALFLYSNATVILKAINQVFINKGITIPALQKTIGLISINDMGNGRDIVYAKAFEVIKRSPIIGHGVGYFEMYSGGNYAHNYFLQILCEFGVVGLIGAGIFLITIITILLRDKELEENKYIALLFSLSVSLFTSGVYWTSFIYIYFMFYFVSNYNWKTKTMEERKWLM